MTSYVLGVQPVDPGYATFTVAPHFGSLTWAKGAVPTPYGQIFVSWVKKGASYSLNGPGAARNHGLRSAGRVPRDSARRDRADFHPEIAKNDAPGVYVGARSMGTKVSRVRPRNSRPDPADRQPSGADNPCATSMAPSDRSC